MQDQPQPKRSTVADGGGDGVCQRPSSAQFKQLKAGFLDPL